MADAKVWGSKKENSSAVKAADYSQRKWKIKNGKRELRSPDGTEPETAVGVVRVEVVALRATAAVGEVVPVAAAQQTVRASRGPCGVGHASG